MTNRISTRTLHDSIAQAISSSNQRVMKLQQGLGDGRAIRVPSDDPVGAHQAMFFREQIRAGGQYERSVDTTLSQLTATETALQQIQDVLGDLRSLQASGSDDATGPEARRVMAGQVRDFEEQLVSLGNTRFSGRYLFAGQKTLSAPLLTTRDAEGKVSGVSLNPVGVGGDVKRQLAPDLSLTINVKVTDLFGEGADFFTSMESLTAALLNNDGEKIRALTDSMDQAQARVNDATTGVGSLINRAENMKTRLEQDTTNYESSRSRVEDLDMARAVVDFQSQQTALQAALAAGSKILNLSLLDYL
jgi:flagellar hook-associated protein 3 FlgL